MTKLNWQKFGKFFGFTALLFSVTVFINSVFAAPLTPTFFTWQSQDTTTPAFDGGVNDSDNSTPLEKDDIVQLIWVGANGQIDLPNYDGTVGGDDQLLTTSSIEKGDTIPFPLQNKGYIIAEDYTFDTTDTWAGGTAYVRAWNHPNAGGYNGATFYGDSSTFTLQAMGSINIPTWYTDQSATAPDIQVFQENEIASGATIDFGTTNIGVAVQKSFTLKNLGVESLTITTPFGISAAGFSVSSPPADTNLDSLEETTFELQLDATTAGEFNAAVTIDTNDPDEDPFTINVTGEVVAAEIEVSVDGQNLVDNGAVSFGTTMAGTAVTKVFTIRNVGTTPLEASNLTVPAGFSIVQGLGSPTVLNANETANFSIKMDAVAVGSPSGTAQFDTNDVDEDPFNFTVSGTVVDPEIAVSESGVNIPNGSTTIIDYGSTLEGSPMVKTFTVTNNGSANLTLSGLTVPAGFSIVSGFSASSVAPAGTATFQVRLDATTAGSYSGVLSFVNNDRDENPFNFTVKGNVTAMPITEIQVLDGAINVVDNSGLVDFGSTTIGSAIQKTFTVNNTGTADLTLANLAVPAGFSIISNFGASTVAPNGSTSFVVQLDAAAANLFEGTLSFSTNDTDENPFNFTVSGNVTAAPAPEIEVDDGAQLLVDGVSTVDFGSTVMGSPIVKELTVINNGTAALTLSAPTLPAGFSVLAPFGSTNLSPSESTTIQIQLDAAAVGSYAGSMSFANNDSDENPFNLVLLGVVQSAPAPEIVVLDGTTNINDNSGHVNFGSTITGAPVVKTFTVRNTGSANLSLSSLSVPAGFSVVSTFGSSTVTPGATTTFRVQLNATAVGSSSGALTIGSNDADENPFNFTVSGNVTAVATPDIAVLLNGVELSGETVSYGSTTVGTPVVKSFTVKNLGSANLTLSEPIAVPAGFSVVSSFANTTLVPGGSTTFKVQLNGDAPGNPTGNIQLTSDDPDQASYAIPVEGSVTLVSNPQPDVALFVDGVAVANGGTVDLGEVIVESPAVKTFVVSNLGTADLNLSALTVPAGYTVVSSFSSATVGAGDSATFQVQIDAAATGTSSGMVSFTTNDTDENPFAFTITSEIVDSNTALYLPIIIR